MLQNESWHQALLWYGARQPYTACCTIEYKNPKKSPTPSRNCQGTIYLPQTWANSEYASRIWAEFGPYIPTPSNSELFNDFSEISRILNEILTISQKIVKSRWFFIKINGKTNTSWKNIVPTFANLIQISKNNPRNQTTYAKSQFWFWSGAKNV